MRVLHLLHPAAGAGSTISTVHLCAGLARRGVSVGLACEPSREIQAVASLAGVGLHPLSFQAGRRIQNARAVARLLEGSSPDLLQTNTTPDRDAVTWLGLTRRLPCPVVFAYRDMPRAGWLIRRIESRVARRLIAVSRSVGAALEHGGIPRSRIAVIPNGVVTERLDRVVTEPEVEHWRRRMGWDQRRHTIGMVARLKDQAILVRALHHLEPPVRLVLAGIEPTDELRSLSALVPARHSVVILPFDSDVRPVYELLEVVLLASRAEGLPQSLLEAMALGKPVIASAVSGNRDLISDGENGLLVPATDAPAWGRAITGLLADQERARRLGTAARQTARERFSLVRTVDLTLELYRVALGSPAVGVKPPSPDRPAGR